ncbi:AEC family transporter [Thalassococcus lentus]|uniref:AEC family transporter n=1 Tax=Thalassococcus lentus TaxID=1210524 RepID=A0ABT4XXN2_9RHOB|nr:AEC family transporter [Thalassococcus lentus]MDA7426642.1 AEC family transporter [Thalassococcus lentus]
MLTILTHNILPVFSLLALGFVLGRTKHISRDEAAAVNRISFLILQPGLILPLIASVDFAAFVPEALFGYVACQAVMFLLGFSIARFVLRREFLEAWLLGMAMVFVNSLLYILPISILIYGEATLPITAVVAWDASVSFAFFIITTDLMANRNASPAASLRRIALNPVLLAIALGAVLNLAAIPIPVPALTAMEFAGAAAAPLTLFALGVILSGHSLVPNATVATMSALKLLVLPAMVFGVMALQSSPAQWEQLLILNAAGPSGAMAFALAMLYGVRTDTIAPVIIWTSTLSLISLAWLA